MDLFTELQWRGLVYDATEGVQDVLARERLTGYIGFDPTAPSLHVGSLLVMTALAHMQRCRRVDASALRVLVEAPAELAQHAVQHTERTPRG